jgi:hypothetical protein
VEEEPIIVLNANLKNIDIYGKYYELKQINLLAQINAYVFKNFYLNNSYKKHNLYVNFLSILFLAKCLK